MRQEYVNLNGEETRIQEEMSNVRKLLQSQMQANKGLDNEHKQT